MEDTDCVCCDSPIRVKLKRKIDTSVNSDANTASTATTTSTTTSADTIFFGDKDHNPSSNKNIKTSNGSTGASSSSKHAPLPSLSVQIVQQISSHSQQEASQTIHTNVTVSSRYGNSNSPNPGGASHSVLTSVQCKQEPSDDNRSAASNTPTPSSSIHNPHIDHELGIGIDDVDELQNILDSIEKEEIDNNTLLHQISEFDKIFKSIQDSEKNDNSAMYGPLGCISPGISKGLYPGGPLSNIFDNNQNMNTAAMTNPNTIPVPSAIPEPTGPAAETLKQMAAQHQHQHSPGYPMKSMDHFSDGLRNGGYPPNYSQLYRSPNTPTSFPYNHTPNHHLGDASQLTPDMAGTMVYGSTKPLTHYSNDQGQHNSPSSLQQLQNQVQSHFKPSASAPHQMQITQTQHMQVSHGPHSMQLSQTQQVQMQPSPQQISMSQQQNFSMGQQQMVSEQMKMQMMEKMRMEQQQARMPPHYMGRPPPEYKMSSNARPQGPYPNPSPTAGNPNPLQTMQNMVNQTSAYGAVKTEVAGPPASTQAVNGLMQSTQISAMQQQTMSGALASNGPHMSNLPQSNQGIRQNFHPQQQHMQQPPAYSSVDTASRTASTYTSAIMRNQRPPNVNVGPDGLNISQPRTHADWPRSGMMGAQHAGMRPGMQQTSAHGMTQSAAMSAHMMQYQRPPHYGAGPATGSMAAAAAAAAATNMAQMQQQQQVRGTMPGQMNRVGPGMMPNGTQMMMQHQSMQVSQQMNIHSSSPGYTMGGPSPGASNGASTGYSMGGPSPGATSSQNTGYNLGGPSPGATSSASGYSIGGPSQQTVSQTTGFPGPPSSTPNQDEFLHFLDNPLSSQPMFDTLHSSTPDDFSLFEDILNGK
ncbi:neurogenic protein mastermind-like isoform X2 [Physella acuta]|uniref:neurogenic protein mastermind-like isoform X2 n=1 Tax=Physella acuta TaxID=109671 RepID=UPI0027DC6665|nr:neurogenic protein mastermind-like isoform X2 [Physella acuta]